MDSAKRILAIIASGAGTRMSAFTGNNHIPKLLLNIGSKTILCKIIESTKKLEAFDKCYIVLGSQSHIDMVQQHVAGNLTSLQDKFEYVLHDKLDGSAGAVADLHNVIAKDYAGQHYAIMLHWSDIYAPMLYCMSQAMFDFTETDYNDMTYLKTVNCATRTNDTDEHLYIVPIHPNRIVHHEIAVHDAKLGKFALQSVLDKSVFGIYAFSDAFYDNFCKVYDVLSTECDCEDDKLSAIDVTTVFNCMADSVHQNAIINWCKFDQWATSPDLQIEIYGDSASYTDACKRHENEKLVRYFNAMTYTEDTCKKTSLNERGHKLLENEKAWYRLAQKFGISCVPRIYDMQEHSIMMERIKGSTVKEYIDKFDAQYECPVLAQGMLAMFKEQIDNELQTIVSYDENIVKSEQIDAHEKLEALYKEYVTTTQSRFKEVDAMFANIKSFNGVELEPFDALMSRLDSWVRATAKHTKFAFMHGDPHTGNVMIDDNQLKLYLIDPRGYFGDGKHCKMGDADYDIAKFAFGLNGNTNFARASMHLLKAESLDNGQIAIQATVEGYDLDSLPLTTRQKLLVALCWLKFPAWLKNNPAEAIITYCHGNVLTKRYLAKLGF